MNHLPRFIIFPLIFAFGCVRQADDSELQIYGGSKVKDIKASLGAQSTVSLGCV